jgi:chromosomal replication initiation ATPase DnaA
MPAIETAEDLLAHYAAIKKRMHDAGAKFNPKPVPTPPVKDSPQPVEEVNQKKIELRKYSPKEIKSFLMFSVDPLATAAEFAEQVKPRVWWTDISNLICAHFNKDYGIIFGSCRAKELAEARQLAWALAGDLCPHLSLTAIGRLCDRDHSTIIHGIRKGKGHPLFEKFRDLLKANLNEEIKALQATVSPEA